MTAGDCCPLLDAAGVKVDLDLGNMVVLELGNMFPPEKDPLRPGSLCLRLK